MLGDNLLALIKAYRYQGIPSHMVRKFVRHVSVALDFLHTSCHVIHTDLKPENVLLTKKVGLTLHTTFNLEGRRMRACHLLFAC